MALVIAVIALLSAVLLHAAIMRLPLPLGSVAAFVAVASAGALGLAAALFGGFGVTAETLAALLIYAFGCELYLFLSTFSLASISSNILAELRRQSLTQDELARRYASERMARLRIERLLAAGLVAGGCRRFEAHPEGRTDGAHFREARGLIRPLTARWRPPEGPQFSRAARQTSCGGPSVAE